MPEIIYPDLSYNVQGALYDVYNALRYQDLSESGWEKALMIALADGGVPAKQQAEYELRYKGYRIGRFFADVVADDKLLLELKATDNLLPIHVAQVLTYLKVTGLTLGILVNFGRNGLEIQRIPRVVPHPLKLSHPTSVLLGRTRSGCATYRLILDLNLNLALEATHEQQSRNMDHPARAVAHRLLLLLRARVGRRQPGAGRHPHGRIGHRP